MARYEIGSVETFEDGRARRVEIPGHALAVVRVGDDFYAIDDTCSHAEASLSQGRVEGFEIECPHHGARFDLRTGRPLTLPAVHPVRTWRVACESGVLYVETDEASGSQDGGTK